MNMTAKLGLDIGEFQSKTKAAQNDLKKVGDAGAAASRRMDSGFRTFDGPRRIRMDRAEGPMRGLGSSLGRVADIAGPGINWMISTLGTIGAVAGSATVAVGSLAAVDSVKQAAGWQRSRLEIARFAGGLKEAIRIQGEIDELAIKTPFQTSSVEEVTKGLLTAGVAGEKVMDVVRKLAAVAGNDEDFVRLGGALGVGYANKKFELERVKQFLEAQINLVPDLGAVLGTDDAGVFEAISKGKVTFDEMTEALGRMSEKGGQFFGLMEARSKDLPGQWSTLLGNVEMLEREMGKPALEPLMEAVRILNEDMMPGLTEKAKSFGESLGNAAAGLVASLASAEKFDWSALWTDFLAGGMATAYLFGDSLTKEISKALDFDLSKRGPFAAGSGAGNWLKETLDGKISPDEEAFKAKRNFEKSREADLRGFNRDHRAYWEQDNPRGSMPGHEYEAKWWKHLETGNLFSPKTSGLLEEWKKKEKAAALSKITPTVEPDPNPFKAVATAHGRFGSGEGADAIRQEIKQRWVSLYSDLVAEGKKLVADNAPPPIADPPKAIPAPYIPTAEDAAEAAAAVEKAREKAGTSTRYGVPGAFQSQINRIAGRSSFELVAENSTRQTELLQKAVRELAEIRRKMGEDVTVNIPPGVFTER